MIDEEIENALNSAAKKSGNPDIALSTRFEYSKITLILSAALFLIRKSKDETHR